MIVEPKDITILGETNFRSMRKKFGIKRDDRLRHVYIIGKSGSGKSVLLENMVMQDINSGNGCCVMDPHGDLAEKIINFIPNERMNDVVYFNPADLDHPIAFNVFEGAQTDSSKNLVASGLIGIFKKMWADSWGPRLEYVLRNTIISLMYDENATLLGINKMFTDKNYRMSVIEKVKDPVVKAFWLQEYEQYPAKELPMIISPIQNKVGQFLSNSLVRNILGQVKSTIDLRDIMDNKKILLVNLAKGRIGEDNSSLIGSMLVTKLYLAAMSRIDLPEEKRNDFYLYVDEFQNFATESFADILSEARKYRLALILAHQYVTQLPEIVSDAIFGNGGTLIAFRVGSQDAEIFEKEFSPDFTIEDLVNIPKWNVVLKMLIDGVTSKAFSAATLAPLTLQKEYENRGQKIIDLSRKKYSRNREDVERMISDATLDFAPKSNTKPQEIKKELIKSIEQKKVLEKMYDANCWVCGIKMNVPFQPDARRPIYCVDCLKKIREKLIPEPRENKFTNSQIHKSINGQSDKSIIHTENSRTGNSNARPQNHEESNRNNTKENTGSKSQVKLNDIKQPNSNGNNSEQGRKPQNYKPIEKKNHNASNDAHINNEIKQQIIEKPIEKKNIEINKTQNNIKNEDSLKDFILEMANGVEKNHNIIQKTQIQEPKEKTVSKELVNSNSTSNNETPENKENIKIISLEELKTKTFEDIKKSEDIKEDIKKEINTKEKVELSDEKNALVLKAGEIIKLE